MQLSVTFYAVMLVYGLLMHVITMQAPDSAKTHFCHL